MKPEELRLVREKLSEPDAVASATPRTGWGKALLEITGKAKGPPADYSENSDHYLYGVPKR